MAKRDFTGTPITDSVKIHKLRLGDALLQCVDGQWVGEHIYFLSEASIDSSIGVYRSNIYAHDNLQTVHDRLINPEAYALSALPLHPCEWDLPEAATRGKKMTLSAPVLNHAPKVEPTFDIGRPFRFLKQIDEQEAADIGLDHRTLRLAAQHLYPGANATIRHERGTVSGRIKAVGFGICGPIGVCLHTAGTPGRDLKAMAGLPSDFWYDASAVDITVHDKTRPGQTLMNFHHLRRMTAPSHA